jgi:hypothetical protein
MYFDALLVALRTSAARCSIGSWYVGALAWANDVVLNVPSAHAMQLMLAVWETFGTQYNVIFNVDKTKCVVLALSCFRHP